jgi:hypothetical protein
MPIRTSTDLKIVFTILLTGFQGSLIAWIMSFIECQVYYPIIHDYMYNITQYGSLLSIWISLLHWLVNDALDAQIIKLSILL